MLSPDAFLNKIVSSRLNLPHQHVIDIQHGLDANKIKGVDNFPILNKTAGFVSHAKAGAEDLIFHPSGRSASRLASMEMRPVHHTTAPEHLGPYVNENRKLGPAPHTNTRVPTHILSNLYGLPPDRTIVLENYAAEASGLADSKHPEADFVDHQLRKNTENIDRFDEAAGFLDDPRVKQIISGDAQAAIRDALTAEEKQEIDDVKKAARGPGRKSRKESMAKTGSSAATATSGATAYDTTLAFEKDDDSSASWKDAPSAKGSPAQPSIKEARDVGEMSTELFDAGLKAVNSVFTSVLGSKTLKQHATNADVAKLNDALSNAGFATVQVPGKQESGKQKTVLFKTVMDRMVAILKLREPAARKAPDAEPPIATLPPLPPAKTKKRGASKAFLEKQALFAPATVRKQARVRASVALAQAAADAAGDVKEMARTRKTKGTDDLSTSSVV